jgi:DNA-binding winged helix-turn-helix (wHTH) protein
MAEILRPALAEGPLRDYLQIVIVSHLTMDSAAADLAQAWLITDGTAPAAAPSIGAIRIDQSGPLRLGTVLDDVMRRVIRKEAAAVKRRIIGVLSFGPWRLDADESTLSGMDGEKTVRLTEKERDILIVLHGADGKVMPRRALLDEIWGYAEGIETHTLETHIYRLRRKIEDDPAKPQYLLTEEDGYRLCDAAAAASTRL